MVTSSFYPILEMNPFLFSLHCHWKGHISINVFFDKDTVRASTCTSFFTKVLSNMNGILMSQNRGCIVDGYITPSGNSSIICYYNMHLIGHSKYQLVSAGIPKCCTSIRTNIFLSVEICNPITLS